MSERTKRVFIGAASGLGTGLSMEFVRSGGYFAGVSVHMRAILAGAIGGLFYLILNICVKLLKKGGGEKAQG